MTKPTEEYTDDNPAPRRQRIVFRRNGPPKVLAEGESPLTVIEPPEVVETGSDPFDGVSDLPTKENIPAAVADARPAPQTASPVPTINPPPAASPTPTAPTPVPAQTPVAAPVAPTQAPAPITSVPPAPVSPVPSPTPSVSSAAAVKAQRKQAAAAKEEAEMAEMEQESLVTKRIDLKEHPGRIVVEKGVTLTRKLDIGMPPPKKGGYLREQLEEILEKLGVSPVRVRYTLARSELTGEHLSQIMRDFNFLSFDNVARALAILSDLEFFPNENIGLIDPSTFEPIRDTIPKFDGFAPIHFDGRTITLAVSDASSISLAGSRYHEYATRIVIAAESTIQMVYRRFFSSTEHAFDVLLNKYKEIMASKTEDLESHPGLLRDTLGALLRHACTLKVSDIHMHMTEYVGLIKLTMDGVSIIFRTIPKDLYNRILSKLITDARVKVEELKNGMKEGAVEFSEQDLELFQDVFSRYGFRLQLGDAKGGYTAVIRILDRNSNAAELAHLNFHPKIYKELMRIIGTSDGLMLVTGPTGSGKTTSLYAMLKEIDPVSRSVQTIENPVEYRHGLWMQYEISRTSKGSEGDEWGKMLKGLLRNAPKVILMGEVRDADTAKTLIEAANTGHLVFTTLHTNTAAMAIARLKKLEVDMDSLAGMLLGVLAQRLTRVLCKDCALPDERYTTLSVLNEEHRQSYLEEYKPYKPMRANPRGCIKCGYSGYTGRKIVYELLVNSPELRTQIEKGASTSQLAITGVERGFSMWDCGLKLVAQGVTSMDALKMVAKEETLEQTEEEDA